MPIDEDTNSRIDTILNDAAPAGLLNDYSALQLAARQIILLEDIRFALNELLAYKQAEVHS